MAVPKYYWRRRTSTGVPETAYGPNGVHVNGLIYMIGNGDLVAYHPLTDTWDALTDPPVDSGFGGGLWYVASRSDGMIVAFYFDGTGGNFLTAYDPTTDTWDDGSILTRCPDDGQRINWGYGRVGDEIFVIGGFRSSVAVQTTYAYNIETDTWRLVGGFPFGSNGILDGRGVEINGELYLWGQAGFTPATIAKKYNPSTDTWDDILGTVPWSSTDWSSTMGIAGKLDNRRVVLVASGAPTYLYDPFTGDYAEISDSSELDAALPAYGLPCGCEVINEILYAWDYAGGGTARLDRGQLPNAQSDIPFLQANDRYQIVALAKQGTTTTTAEFRYWYAGPPSWDHNLAEDTAYPPFHTLDENSTYVPGSIETNFKTIKTGQEDQIDGVFVEFYARPAFLTESTVVSTFSVGFSCRVEGVSVPGWERIVSSSVLTSGIVVSDSQTYSATAEEQAYDTWPNLRSVYLPIRLKGKVRAARVIISDIHLVAIRRIQLMGKTMPNRNP